MGYQVALLLFITLLFGAYRAGLAAGLFGTLVVSLSGFTIVAFKIEFPGLHYGIAAGAPSISSNLILLAAIVVTANRIGTKFRVSAPMIVFVILIGTSCLLVWGGQIQQISGAIELCAALLAFEVGRWASTIRTPVFESFLASAIFVAIGLQTLVAAAQTSGIPLVRAGDVGAITWIDHGRAVGLFSHPSMLGKTVFLLLAFLLPMSGSTSRYVRTMANAAIAIGLIGTLLTLSRANSVAIVSAIVVWGLISSQALSAGRRITLFAVFGASLWYSSVLLGQLADRNAADPVGGQRLRLLESGIDVISQFPIIGVGANYYCEFVGRWDPLAASGFPVHNTFLLAAAELGIPLAVLLFAPLFVAARTSVKGFRTGGDNGLLAATFFALVPGVLVIGMTGWGLLSSPTLCLWFLGLGYLTPRSELELGNSAHSTTVAKKTHRPVA